MNKIPSACIRHIFEPRRSRALLVTLTTLLATGKLAAQTPNPPPKDEVIALSPFTVDASKDEGYVATQSLSGSRFSENLKNIPVPVSVMTAEFLQDLGAFDVQEAMGWSVNTVASGTAYASANEATGIVDAERRSLDVRSRGGVLSTPARNLFKWSANSDSFNISRIDNSRGPNALLFGASSLSGLSNVTTKQALFKERYDVSYNYDSYGGWGRVTLDLNKPLIKEKVALRLNLMKQEVGQALENGTTKKKGIAIATTWRPAKDLTVRFEYERGLTNGIYPKSTIRGVVSAWNHVTVVNTPGALTAAQAAAAGLTIEAANNTAWYVDYTRAGDGPVNWAGNGKSASAGAASFLSLGLPPGSTLTPVSLNVPATLSTTPLFTDLVLPSYSYGALAMAGNVAGDYDSVSAFVEKTFSPNFFVEIAANRQAEDRNWHVTNGGINQVYYDLSRTLPNGYTINGSSANPNFLKPFISGQPSVRTDYNTSDEVRALALYRLKTSWFNQAIGVLASYRESKGGQTRKTLVITNGANPSLANNLNRPRFRYYLTDSDKDVTLLTDGNTYRFGNSTMEFVNTSADSAGQANAKDRLLSMMIGTSGSWLKDQRLYTTAGIRRDKYHASNFNTLVYDPVSAVFIRADLSDKDADAIDSPSVGAVYHLLPWFSIYGNYSKSFVFGDKRQLNFEGKTIDPPIGSSKEYGIKFDFGQKLSGSIGYYDSRQKNNIVTNNPINTNLRNIYTLLGLGDYGQRSDTSILTSTGYEFQLVGNPIKGLTLIANLAVPKSSDTGAFQSFDRFFAASSAPWYAIARNPNDVNAASMNTYLTIITNQRAAIAADSGISTRGNYKVLGNIMARYTFAAGGLRGVQVGAGAQYRGDRKIDRINNQDVFSAPYTEFTMFGRYRFKWERRDCSVQVNVTNPLDGLNLRYTTLDATGLGQAYRISNPRQYRVGLDIGF